MTPGISATDLTDCDRLNLGHMTGATYLCGYWREAYTVLGYDKDGYVHIEWHGREDHLGLDRFPPRYGSHLTTRDPRRDPMIQDDRAPHEHRDGCYCPADHTPPAQKELAERFHQQRTGELQTRVENELMEDI